MSPDLEIKKQTDYLYYKYYYFYYNFKYLYKK